MELKAFADIVSEGIQKEMGEDYSISVVEKFKNKIGIEFVKKSEASLQTHTVHIQDLLGEYNKKDDIETIVQEVISRYNRAWRQPVKYTSWILNWSSAETGSFTGLCPGNVIKSF